MNSFSVRPRAIKLQNAVLVDARIPEIDKQWGRSGAGSKDLIIVRYEYDYLGKRYDYDRHAIALFHTKMTSRRFEESVAAGNTVLRRSE